MRSTIFVRRADRVDPSSAVVELLEGCRWRELIPRGSSVVIKPNLCTHGAARADPHRQYLDRGASGRLRSAAGADLADHDRRVGRGALPRRGGLREQWGICPGCRVGFDGHEPLQG